IATGGGFGTRRLYTNTEEVLFEAQRPLILNSIEELATRSDLLDRSLIVHLPAIPEERRRTEVSFWNEFATAMPRLLGALLDVLTYSLQHLPEVRLNSFPRMADFAALAIATQPYGRYSIRYTRLSW